MDSNTEVLINALTSIEEVVSDGDRISVQLGIPSTRGMVNVQLSSASPTDVRDAVNVSVWCNSPDVVSKGESLAQTLKSVFGYKSIKEIEGNNSTGFSISNSGMDKQSLASRIEELRNQQS